MLRPAEVDGEDAHADRSWRELLDAVPTEVIRPSPLLAVRIVRAIAIVRGRGPTRLVRSLSR